MSLAASLTSYRGSLRTLASCACLLALTTHPGIAPADTEPLLPTDLEYRGAFRLPQGTIGGSTWAYGGWALTYYPHGDPSGPDDGYPGSLFGVGHDYDNMVSEVSIPAPVISASKDAGELPVARTLQPFSDLTEGLINLVPGDTSKKLGGLAYLPPQGGQSAGKLHWTVFEYYNADASDNDSLGWSELDLANPQAAGLWHIGPSGDPEYHSTRTENYLFDIDAAWADAHAGSQYLVSGRSREAGAFGSSQGPALFSSAPWNNGNPPANGTDVDATALLYYPEIYNCWEDGSCYYPEYKACDDWDGGAWLTADAKSSVLIVGSKGLGDVYYGEGRPEDCEDWKGYHCTPYEGQFLFYHPDDLAAVAAGEKQPWEVLPYAVFNPAQYLWPDCRYRLGGAAFDREHGILYVIQKQVDDTSYGDAQPLVHVFKVGTENPVDTFRLAVSKTGGGDGTVVSDLPGIDCGDDCDELYSENEVVALTATSDPGSEFLGWEGDADCNDGNLGLEKDHFCTAIFALEEDDAPPPAVEHCPAYEQSPLFRPPTRQVMATPSDWIQKIQGASWGDEILLADGTYYLNQYAVQITVALSVRSASGNRDAVVIQGQGYGVPSEGFMIMAPEVTIADLTITGMRNHGISIKGELGAEAPLIYNVHLYDIGTQHIKGTSPIVEGVVACSRIGYSPDGVAGDYLNGIDIHGGINWTVRDNELYNIWGDGSGCEVDTNCGTYTPGGGPAILFWNGAAETLVERNRIIDCFRGIALGFGTAHPDGVVRNNFVYQSTSGDAGIQINGGSDTQVDHNTVILGGDYPGAIEIMNSSDLVIRNNLLTRPIWNRGGVTYTAQGNKTDATVADLAAPADPHLNPSSSAVDLLASTTLPVVDDIDGDGRPQGDGLEPGCDELSEESPTSYPLTVAKTGTGSGRVTSEPLGIDCGTDCLETYSENTVVQLTATPEPGSSFGGWSGDADCSDGSVTMDAAHNCVATFAEDATTTHTLEVSIEGNGSGSVSSNPAGIDCGEDCWEPYAEGTVVKLFADPDRGSRFTGWSGDADCADGSVTMNADLHCTATFTRTKRQTLRITAGPVEPPKTNLGPAPNDPPANGRR